MNLEGVYHDLRKISPEKARSLLLRVLERNHKNISRTARILSISRNTVYRALKGPLHDLPKRPKHCPIPPGVKHLLGVVENAHCQDDEASLMVHAERCEHTLAFLERAQRWQDTWNYLRPHFGEGMEGKPPTEKPKSSSPPVP